MGMEELRLLEKTAWDGGVLLVICSLYISSQQNKIKSQNASKGAISAMRREMVI
jgi:hypothetical protein